MSLEEVDSAEAWINMCRLRRSEATCKQGGVSVLSHTYFAIRKSDNGLVGVIDLRHHIDHPILSTWGGHCGYTARPCERGKGYAKEMLRHSSTCRDHFARLLFSLITLSPSDTIPLLYNLCTIKSNRIQWTTIVHFGFVSIIA